MESILNMKKKNTRIFQSIYLLYNNTKLSLISVRCVERVAVSKRKNRALFSLPARRSTSKTSCTPPPNQHLLKKLFLPRIRLVASTWGSIKTNQPREREFHFVHLNAILSSKMPVLITFFPFFSMR